MTPRIRHVYTDAIRARGIELYQQRGPTDAAAILSAEIGWSVGKRTVQRWAQADGLKYEGPDAMAAAHEALAAETELRRERIKGKLLLRVEDALDRMKQPHIEWKGSPPQPCPHEQAPSGAWQQYATTVGILLDKYRLESGEVTGREEHRHTHDVTAMSDSDLIAEAERYLAEAAQSREQRSAGGHPG